MSKRQEIEKIVDDWMTRLGYVPTIEELKTAYTSGELVLTDVQEDAMASIVNN